MNQLTSASVLGGNVEYAIGVNVERDIDFRHATGCRRYTSEIELAEQMVVFSHGTLALVHLYSHAGLVVTVRRERLARLGRNARVARY